MRSTMITSQLPIDKWHDVVGDSTIADAILDRLVHNAYRVFLQGDLLRKGKTDVNTGRQMEERCAQGAPTSGRLYIYEPALLHRNTHTTA